MKKYRLSDSADQKFSTIISRRRVTLRVRYNHTSERWSFDLALDGDYILHGRRIVLNTDLIGPFDFGIGALFAYSDNRDSPSRHELVDGRVCIFHATKEELNNEVA